MALTVTLTSMNKKPENSHEFNRGLLDSVWKDIVNYYIDNEGFDLTYSPIITDITISIDGVTSRIDIDILKHALYKERQKRNKKSD